MHNKRIRSYKLMLAIVMAAVALLAANLPGAPRAAAASGDGWVAVSSGNSHSLGVKQDGTVWAWGNNEYGQLGNGAGGQGKRETSPVQVKGLADVVRVSAGSRHSVAVKRDGTVWAWGDNSSGSLGDGTITFTDPKTHAITKDANRSSPVQVKNLTDVVDVRAGHGINVAVRQDGTVWTWGGAYTGDSTPETFRYDTLAPRQIIGAEHVASVAYGWTSTIGIRHDGSALIWGYNGNGEMGNGTVDGETFTFHAPVALPGFDHVLSVASGSNYNLAVKADGTVWAWGSLKGAKPGAAAKISSPLPIKSLRGVKAVTAGFDTQYALTEEGTVLEWSGFIVDQSDAAHPTVTVTAKKVEGLENIAAIDSGGGWSHMLAVAGDGTLWAWGSNDDGELGDGTTSYRSQPVRVGPQPEQTKPDDAVPAGSGKPAAGGAPQTDPQAVHVTLNGKELAFEQQPVIIGEKTMVPMRAIFQALDAAIDWNGDTRTVTATKGDRKIVLTIGDKIAYVNDAPVELDQPGTIVNDTTVVPVRFIGDALGTNVEWVNATRTVVLTN